MALIRLAADPDELAGAVDVEALLPTVYDAMGLSVDEVDQVEAALEAAPCVIEVRAGLDLDVVRSRLGGGTCGTAKGLTLSPTRVWVVRLDWPGLLAHELAHVVRLILGGGRNELEARRVEDAVA